MSTSLQDPSVKKKVKDALQEASNSLTRIEAERDLIKEIIKTLHEDHDLPKKALSKMVKTYHKSNFAETVATEEEFQTLYETITGQVANP
jgi:hypothetical protein